MIPAIDPQIKQIIITSKTILLIDWPDIHIPLTLLKAGFIVYSYCPHKYSKAKIGQEGDKPVVFYDMEHPPLQVDIVNVYRSEAEHEMIITQHALPLAAAVLWLHPPVVSANTARLAAEKGLFFIEGIDIAAVGGINEA
jgi:predicted CoA-binding protein